MASMWKETLDPFPILLPHPGSPPGQPGEAAGERDLGSVSSLPPSHCRAGAAAGRETVDPFPRGTLGWATAHCGAGVAVRKEIPPAPLPPRLAVAHSGPEGGHGAEVSDSSGQ